MADVVVTVPKAFEWFDYRTGRFLRGLETWIAEGDGAGEPWSGEEWHFYLGGYPPRIKPGERVYVVYNNKLRGYSPLVRLEENMGPPTKDRLLPSPAPRGYALVRHGGAVAVTIEETITGFRGFRYRWWKYEDERPFPDWKTP